MLNFDLNQTPPTVEEIAAERQEIERRLAALRRRVWIGSIVVGVGAGLGLVVGASVGAISIAGAGAVLCVSIVAGVVVFCSRCDGDWGRQSSLDAIDPSDCDRLIADCLADPLCEAYRQKVAALGRKPVKAETKLIREWVAGADAREKERREGIACALVASKEPLPSDADTVANREPTC